MIAYFRHPQTKLCGTQVALKDGKSESVIYMMVGVLDGQLMVEQRASAITKS